MGFTVRTMDSATLETPPKIRKLSPGMVPARSAEDYDRARQMFLDGLTVPQIAKETGIPYKTIECWRTRKQWQNARVQAIISIAGRIVSGRNDNRDAGTNTRNALAAVLQTHCATLAANPAKTVAELANSKDGQGQASILKTLADAGSVLHGWGNEKTLGIMVCDDWRGVEEPEAIEVQEVTGETQSDPATNAASVLQNGMQDSPPVNDKV